jgi:hypothetical protein
MNLVENSLSEKLIVAKLAKKLLAFHGAQISL